MERDETDVFEKWSQDFLASGRKHPIVGAWKRPLFTSRWEHSTDEDEVVYNIQTSTMFIDLRIPRSKPVCSWASRQSLESFSDNELRMYARQHVFGGFSALSSNNGRSLCTRHHCIDWNYIPGKPRPRPNKWFIEGDQGSDGIPFDAWIEWSYATDYNGQSYYQERWKRLPGDEQGNGFRLAMRKKITNDSQTDGIIVAVGDHFNYMIGRDLSSGDTKRYSNTKSLVELVDAAIANGDRNTAISYLSLKGGHGTISSGWVVDCSIQSWAHGKRLIDCVQDNQVSMEIKVTCNGSDFRTWNVALGNSSWQIYECSLSSAAELEFVLRKNTNVSLDSRL